jgi:hypothetical protein
MVTDTLLIAKNADCFIYVARANFLDKRMLAIPDKLYKEQNYPICVCFLMVPILERGMVMATAMVNSRKKSLV